MILAQYIAVFIILAFAVIWVIRAVVGRSRRKNRTSCHSALDSTCSDCPLAEKCNKSQKSSR